jgi:hypothetical protein
VPTAALRAADLAPPSLRDAIRARVWKFCGRNVYSTSRLAAAGIRLPASLLQIA